MSDLLLPARTYEEAIPWLRRPYQATQIRPLIITVPKNEKAPCRVGLYTIGETLMDRFTLLCGANWDVAFTTEIHEDREKERDGELKTFHYFKIKCTVTVFGQVHEDSGEGESESRALAEFDARAQAFKRGARWHGPGQCLYVFGGEEFIMRRGDAPGELRVSKRGNPFFDEQARQAVRDAYLRWLRKEGDALFGPPLDHLALATAMLTGVPLRIPAPGSPPVTVPRSPSPTSAFANGSTAATTREVPVASAASEAAKPVAETQTEYAAMPDEPAPAATSRAAQHAGYSEPVARHLSNLVRQDGQTKKLAASQLRTIENWLGVLRALEVPQQTLLDAIAHNATKPLSQETRQAYFAKWLASRAAGQPSTAPQIEQEPEQPKAAARPADGEQHDQLAVESRDAEDEQQRVREALARVHVAMGDHDLSAEAVNDLAALAICQRPGTKVDWQQIPASKLHVIADLLDSAAAIGWGTQTLQQEVLNAANGSRQSTPAGRWSALANHITDAAEIAQAQAAQVA